MSNTANRLAGALAVLALCSAAWLRAEEPTPAWPRRVVAAPHTVALYEPQIESYDQDWLTGRAAVSVAVADEEPVFGAIWFGLRLTLNADKSLGRVGAFRLDQTRFPEGDAIEKSALERLIAGSLIGTDLAMAPLLQSLEREQAVSQAAGAGSEAVPDILFTTMPVALVRIDGDPELRAVPDTDLLSVVNSTTPILLQKGTAKWFMQVEGQWLTAPAINGPWQDAGGVPESVKKAVAEAAVEAVATAQPQIVVVTRATEVIQTDGEPRYTVITGTDLLYVNNTDADLFLDIAGQKHYALLAGRWFATASLEKGPWEVVLPEQLPAGFAAIPSSSGKYGVLAHVPGTVAAQEAVQDAAVPRMQSIKRDVVNLTVEYEGDPEFVQAGQTTVYYAVNTPYSVVRVDPYYYLCHSGVWYYGVTAVGPWSVSVSVPGVIYTMPPTCPVYPVTYVRVYDWTPDVVYFGFTAGYVGWYAGYSGLVFGFSYYDDGWWHRHHSHSRYFYHGYHCGYRPYHGWGGPPRPGPRQVGAGGLAPGYWRHRPGPEYHMYSGGKPQQYTSSRYVANNRPTRYQADRGALGVGKGRPSHGIADLDDNRLTKPGRNDGGRAAAGPGSLGKPGLGGNDGGRRPGGADAITGAERPGKPGTTSPVLRGDGGADRRTTGKPGLNDRDRAPAVRPTDADQDRRTTGKPGLNDQDRAPAVRPADADQDRRTTGKPGLSDQDRTPAVRPTDADQDRRGTAKPTVQSQGRERAPEARPVAPTPSFPAVPAVPMAPKSGSGGGSSQKGKGLNSSFFEQRKAESMVREATVRTAPALRPQTPISRGEPSMSTGLPTVTPKVQARPTAMAEDVTRGAEAAVRTTRKAAPVAVNEGLGLGLPLDGALSSGARDAATTVVPSAKSTRSSRSSKGR